MTSSGKRASKSGGPVQDPEKNQRSDQVEPMHRGARAEADDYADGQRQKDSERGVLESDVLTDSPGGTTGEHSGQKPIADAGKK